MEKTKQYAPFALLLVLILPIFIGLYLLVFEGTLFVLPKTHFYLVVISAFVSFLLALVAFKDHKRNGNMTTFMVSIGFMGVAILYGFHGLITPNYSLIPFNEFNQQINAFVFFGDMSRLWIAVMLLIPARVVLKNTDPLNKRFILILTGLLLTMIALLIAFYPQVLPQVKAVDGTDTLFTILFKVLTLIIIGIVTLRYYDSYKINKNVSMLFLTIGTLFIFQAVIIFMISTPWGLVWWFAHFLYLFSYISIGIGIIYNYRHEESIEYFDVMAQINQHVDSLNITNEQLRVLATTDSLTQLYNRSYILSHIQERIDKTPETHFSVLFIDLDGFKEINDDYGHHVGDAILKILASRLKTQLGKLAYVGRIGGDEFLVVIDGSDETLIKQQCTPLFDRLKETINIASKAFNVSFSVGISRYPADGTALDDLIRHSDYAMYAAKRNTNTKEAVFFNSMTDKLKGE